MKMRSMDIKILNPHLLYLISNLSVFYENEMDRTKSISNLFHCHAEIQRLNDILILNCILSLLKILKTRKMRDKEVIFCFSFRAQVHSG